MKRYLADRFAFRRGPEFMVRAFIPNSDGNYVNPEDADEGPPSPGEPVDRRPRAQVMRAILARRGGPAFRDAQLVRFGRRCAFSRCATVDVLEAAHIRPYRTGADNAADNGLLLRADLHTLYDLDLLAIDPDTSLVAVHVSIEEPTYQSLHGGGVIQPAGSVDMTALRQRWALFKAKVVP